MKESFSQNRISVLFPFSTEIDPFVRKKQTEVLISIGKKSHKLDVLPIPMDFQKMTFARYSSKPLIATLNHSHNSVVETLDLELGQHTYEKGNYIYEIDWNNQKASIKSMSVKNNIHKLTIRFITSLPCLNTVFPNIKLKGSFIISGHQSVGTISGDYHLQSKNETVTIRVIPSKGWNPKITKLSTWFLFTVAKVFKKWPTTYQWDAKLQKNSEGVWHMHSKWIRTGKFLKD